MTSHKPLLAEISNINIFHITQYFWVISYKRNQWNLPNILAYISGIFDDFFKAGLVPLNFRFYILPLTRNIPIGRYGSGPALQALLPAGSVLVNPPIQKAWSKVIKKYWWNVNSVAGWALWRLKNLQNLFVSSIKYQVVTEHCANRYLIISFKGYTSMPHYFTVVRSLYCKCTRLL